MAKTKKVDSMFDKWDTTPVKVNRAFRDDSYSPLEWRLKQRIDRMGSESWDNSAFESDLTKLEL